MSKTQRPEISRYGVVQQHGADALVVFQRYLPHSPDDVWAAITDPRKLEAWFPGLRLECRPAGRFDIWFDGECEGPAHISGVVARFEPRTALQCGTICWEIKPDGDGVRLEFRDTLNFNSRLSTIEVINSVLAGWHRHLDLLETALAGRTVDLALPELDYSRIDVRGRAAAS